MFHYYYVSFDFSATYKYKQFICDWVDLTYCFVSTRSISNKFYYQT